MILKADDQAQYMKKSRLSITQVYFVFKTDPNTYIPRRRSSRLQNGSARNRDLYQCRTQYYNDEETHFFSWASILLSLPFLAPLSFPLPWGFYAEVWKEISNTDLYQHYYTTTTIEREQITDPLRNIAVQCHNVTYWLISVMCFEEPYQDTMSQ